MDLLGLNPYVEVEDSAIPIGELKPREKMLFAHASVYENKKIRKRINEDLHLETASAEKRVKIAQVLNNINWKRVFYLYGGT